VGGADHLAALIEQALPLLEAAGDDFALMIAYSALGQVASMHAQMDAMVEACERAASHGQRAGLPNQGLVAGCGGGRFHGTTPVSELLAWQEEQDAGARGHPRLRAQRAAALAMLGRSAEARSLLAELRAELAECGGGLMLAAADVKGGIDIELLAGDPAAAVVAGEEGCRVLEELGEESVLATSAGSLAQAYHALDRIEEAEVWGEPRG
jgi:hypothetical protein